MTERMDNTAFRHMVMKSLIQTITGRIGISPLLTGITRKSKATIMIGIDHTLCCP